MDQVQAVLSDAIADGAFPGCAYAFGRLGEALHFGELGRQTYASNAHPIEPETVWDLASVSKVVATTTAFMLAFQNGQLGIDQRVSQILPEFAGHGKAAITFENLLVHNSGLVAFRRYQLEYGTAAEIWDAICNESLVYETGTQSIYSDLSMIVVAHAIERAVGLPFNVFLQERIWNPLEMRSTTTRPTIDDPRFAPTEAMEDWRIELRKKRGQPHDAEFIQGEVHDPTAAVMGYENGTVGHAGLFSTTRDLAKFAQMMLQGGRPLLESNTIAMFTQRRSNLSTRALGWDTKSAEGSSAGSFFGPNSYGHTGYTGTSLWIDPDAKIFAILLTNRVHPTSENLKIAAIRPAFHDAVFRALSQS